jgi:hypothetical protein
MKTRSARRLSPQRNEANVLTQRRCHFFLLICHAVLILCIPLPMVRAGEAPPSILVQPRSQSASLGADITFRITASGDGDLTYQWQQNQANLSATNATLALTNLTLLNAGDYVAIVSNSSGSVTSRVATLTIDLAFTKITTGAIVNDRGDSTGTAWVDYDRDGNLDLFVSNFGSPRNFLYRNQEWFFPADDHTRSHGRSEFRSCVWGDYDNDGDLDLFVAVGSMNDLLYRNEGGGVREGHREASPPAGQLSRSSVGRLRQ